MKLKKKTQTKPKIKLKKTLKATPKIETKKPLLKKKESEPVFKCLYDYCTCKQDYENDGVKWIEPMTAKEPLDQKMLQSMLENDNVIAEDKLDGTRCLLHINNGTVRLFSRTVSRKTGWFSENSDRIPQIRDISVPDDLGYTVIDGELKIPDKPFETVSGILNCLPKEAVDRQEVDGKIVLNAFDILWYRGECVENEPLVKRKAYLKEILTMLNSNYVKNVQWFTRTIDVPFTETLKFRYLGENKEMFSTYPLLYEAIRKVYSDHWNGILTLTKAEYYEYVVIHGGEGIMLKDPNGKYYHKRGREFTKYKKFLTRDCIAVRLTEPTREYTGKELSTWGYWVDSHDKKMPYATNSKEVKDYKKAGCTPVTKPYYYGWFGNVVFGVVVDDEDIAYLQKVNGKAFKSMEIVPMLGIKVLVVGECAGFDDVTKKDFTDHPVKIIGSCIEVRCNEIFKKTGKLRHPRFMRLRKDKNVEACIFKDHIQSDGNMNE